MKHEFTLEYWQDDDWFVGRLKEVPGVFSQGETLAELERNIEDAYQLVMANGRWSRRPHRPRQSLYCSTSDESSCVDSRARGPGLRAAETRIEARPLPESRHGRQAPIPRHGEIKESLVRLIRKQLGLVG